MKVVCESCQAKYQVPDERVAGKKLKIRCKRCGATVLIRGDLVGTAQAGAVSQAPQAHASGIPVSLNAPASYSVAPLQTEANAPSPEIAGYEWHVSLDGDTRGPFGLDDLRNWLVTTPGGWEAHVWREGFHDWIEARSCAELDPPALPAVGRLQDDEQPTQTFQVQSPQGAQFLSEVAAPAPGSQRPISQVSVAPARARRASGFADASHAASSQVPSARASHAPHAPSAPPATTERHDESLLFHTASLQTMTGTSSAPAPGYVPGPNPGFASGEGSGLIDIRALASLARQSTATLSSKPASAATPSPSGAPLANGAGVDDGLSYGNEADDRYRGGPASLSSAYARVDSLAPVTHTPTSNAALPLAILGGCALVAAAVLAAVLFTRSSRGADVATGPHDAPVAATAQPNAAADAEHHAADSPAGDKPQVADSKAEAAEVGEGEEDEVAAGKPKRQPRAPRTAAEEKKNGATPEEKTKPKKEEKAEPEDSPDTMLAERAKPVKQTPAPTVAAATPPPAAEAPADNVEALNAKQAAKPAGKPPQSIDDLMGTAADSPAPAAKTAAAPAPATGSDDTNDLPEAPSRDEIIAAMHGVESNVRACPTPAEPAAGTVEVAFTVAGPTGRVTNATVNGITGNVATCVAKAVKGARFPHFTKPSFSIKYPYRF